MNHIYQCSTCQREREKLTTRQKFEKDKFVQVMVVHFITLTILGNIISHYIFNIFFQLYQDFKENGNPAICAISLAWFKHWEKFIDDKMSGEVLFLLFDFQSVLISIWVSRRSHEFQDGVRLSVP